MPRIRLLFFVFGLVTMFFASSVAVLAAGTANVTLSASKQSFTATDNVTVDVTISNPNKRAIRILKWYTPVDGVEESLFTITLDGKPVEYTGPHYKRPAPVEKDFLILKSGEIITRTVNLSEFYDLTETGLYAISYNIVSLDLYKKGNPMLERADQLKSDGIMLWIEGREAKIVQPEAPSAVAGMSGYTRCTSSQTTSVASARNAAAAYSTNASNYLDIGTVSARYTTWFGVYNSSRYNTVRTNFTKIRNAMDNASMNFNCGCKKSYYAYVYPNQPYNIYLCRAFFTAPLTGTDSKAGTLVHETSHFTIVAGTDDWVYGQSGARSLAISDPDKAVNNADSHEYFAENTPNQQ